MFDFWKDDISEERETELLQKAADEICKRKLDAPAILYLELHKPLAYVASQAAIAFSPFIGPFLGFQNVNDYTRILAKRENVERLIQMIESRNEQGPDTMEHSCNTATPAGSESS